MLRSAPRNPHRMSQAPTAKGLLAATPFAHLLIYALDRRLTGTIVFEEPSHAKHAIYLVDGAPAQALRLLSRTLVLDGGPSRHRMLRCAPPRPTP